MSHNQKTELLKEFDKAKIINFINKENLLIHALLYNKREEINLKNGKIDFLIRNTDLKNSLENGWNALMVVLVTNLSQEINITSEQLDYLLENSNIKHQNKLGETALIMILQGNKTNNININKKQLDYLINNSNIKTINKFGFNALFYALAASEAENIKLNKQQWLKLIKESFFDSRILADSIYIYLADMKMDWRKEKILKILAGNKNLIKHIVDNKRLTDKVKNKILAETDKIIINKAINSSIKKIRNKI